MYVLCNINVISEKYLSVCNAYNVDVNSTSPPKKWL